MESEVDIIWLIHSPRSLLASPPPAVEEKRRLSYEFPQDEELYSYVHPFARLQIQQADNQDPALLLIPIGGAGGKKDKEREKKMSNAKAKEDDREPVQSMPPSS